MAHTLCVNYMKRLLSVERKKAEERQGEKTSVENKTDVLRADSETAKQFGISKDTMRTDNTADFIRYRYSNPITSKKALTGRMINPWALFYYGYNPASRASVYTNHNFASNAFV